MFDASNENLCIIKDNSAWKPREILTTNRDREKQIEKSQRDGMIPRSNEQHVPSYFSHSFKSNYRAHTVILRVTQK